MAKDAHGIAKIVLVTWYNPTDGHKVRSEPLHCDRIQDFSPYAQVFLTYDTLIITTCLILSFEKEYQEKSNKIDDPDLDLAMKLAVRDVGRSAKKQCEF